MDHDRMRRLHSAGLKPIRYDIALRAKREIAVDTWLFLFDKPGGFAYRAGQHARMKLRGEYRFWSFASAPYEDGLAFAVRMRESRFKQALKALPRGAKVRIEMLPGPPRGAFWLAADAERPAVFLCGGIGVVPAVSMVKQALHDGSARRLVLIHACRRVGDAPFLDELRALADVHDNFTYVPTFTGPEPADRWEGETGRIDADTIARRVPDIAESDIYVAGLHGMVRDVRAVLIGMGVPDTAVMAEDFGAFDVGRKRRPWMLAALVSALVLVHGGLVLAGLTLAPPVWMAGAAILVIVLVKLRWLIWKTRSPSSR